MRPISQSEGHDAPWLIDARWYYVFDRAIDVFAWQGMLGRKAAAIPEIMKSLVTVAIYLSSGYVIIAVIYNQPVTGLVISSGVLLAILGLALQPVLGDVVGGISLSIDRPFVAGDWIELENGILGKVISTDWRATRVLTRNNTVYVIPNSRLSNATIHNFDQPNKVYGFTFLVPVSRRISPRLVLQLLLEAALKSPTVLDYPKPIVRLSDVNESPMRYVVFVHCRDYDLNFKAKGEVLENAWHLFDKAGFTFAARAMEAEYWRGQPPQAREPNLNEVLEEISLLSPLTRDERRSLVDSGVVRNFIADDPVVLQGEEGLSAFVILAGLVRVHRTMEEDGRDLELARLGKFDFFGEMSLLTGAPRSANITAYTDCQLLEIPKACMIPILEQRPELADELAKLMAERKLKGELLSSAVQQKSMSETLKEYTEVFAQTIRGFFAVVKAADK